MNRSLELLKNIADVELIRFLSHQSSEEPVQEKEAILKKLRLKQEKTYVKKNIKFR